MRSIAVARPAAALTIASIALAGIAETSQAAKPFSGSTIKKRSLPGDRVKLNSLSGVQINESRLGVVPVAKLSNFAELAKAADTAKTADFAKTAESARTAETARTSETARTAELAKDAQKLNGRDHTAFMANAVRTVFRTSNSVPNGIGAAISVSCPTEEKAIGGGGAWLVPNTDTPSQLNAPLTSSMPSPATPGVNEMTGWAVSGYNATGAPRVLRVYATCVPRTA